MTSMDIWVDGLAKYVERAVDGMSDILRDLGDDLANRRPGLPGANSPYAIVRHCLGVMEFWGGQVIAGRVVQRDRDAEFRATGTTAGLTEAAGETVRRLRADLATCDPASPVRGAHPGIGPGELETADQGHALLHILEEMCQHLGQLEITRDLLLRDAGRS